MLVKAYQYGTFSKIQEFIEFRRRLDTSLQHAITRTELVRLEYIHSSFQTKFAVQFFQEQNVSEVAYDDDFIAARSDNRDFKVFISCNPEDSLNAEQRCKTTASTNATWVQVISYIFNILSILCETKGSGRDLNKVAVGFRELLEREETKTQITEQEFGMACYVSELTDAFVCIKADPKKTEQAIEALKEATSILEDQCKCFICYTSRLYESFHLTNHHYISEQGRCIF